MVDELALGEEDSVLWADLDCDKLLAPVCDPLVHSEAVSVSLKLIENDALVDCETEPLPLGEGEVETLALRTAEELMDTLEVPLLDSVTEGESLTNADVVSVSRQVAEDEALCKSDLNALRLEEQDIDSLTLTELEAEEDPEEELLKHVDDE